MTAALGLLIIPTAHVSAGIFDWFAERASARELSGASNVRTMTLLGGGYSQQSANAFGGGDIAIVDGTALAADTSPLAGSPIKLGTSDQISLYVVREGDTLSQIAEMFGVTPNTIRWANDISAKGTIQPGDQLVILPITGVKHIVAKGDTLASIAKKYKADTEEITQFNGLEKNAALAVGDEVIIPHGEIAPVATNPAKPASGGVKPAAGGGPTYAGYYMRPVSGGVRTQGIHGYNAVDIASSFGSAIYASAAGEVIISRGDGWNGGYGSYIVIKHNNGTQTLYSHLSGNYVSVGQQVAQGETIGAMGASGKATGTHLHFEIRGASNPF